MSQVVNVRTGPYGKCLLSSTCPREPYVVEVCVYVSSYVHSL